jgi:hypothetical protein
MRRENEQDELAVTDVSLRPDQAVAFTQPFLKRPVVERVFVELIPAGKVEGVGRAAGVHEFLDAKGEGMGDVQVGGLLEAVAG